MKILSTLSFLGLVFLARASELERRGPITTATYTQQFCSTFLGTVSLANVPTTTMVVTITIVPFATITVTPASTVTPPTIFVSQITTKTITTTKPTITDTFTETDTTTETGSITNTITSTSLTTTTLTTVIAALTSTVPIPSGFAFPSPNNARPRMVKFKKNKVEERNFPLEFCRSNRVPAARFPSRVVCNKAIQVIRPYTISVKSMKSTFTTVPAVTNTITSTTTTTSTTILANASTTLTVSTSTTTITTIPATFAETDTVTETVTQQSPASTTYAACGPQNQISRDNNGDRLALFAVTAPLNPVSNTDSAYDCCVLCQQTPNCAGSNFIAVLRPQSASCQLNLANSCPAGQALVAETFYTKDLTADIVVSNGLCGQYQFVDGNGVALNLRGGDAAAAAAAAASASAASKASIASTSVA